ncbi:MAG TPA: hypothetical protein VIO60_10630 [Rectinemataceae bacterium]
MSKFRTAALAARVQGDKSSLSVASRIAALIIIAVAGLLFAGCPAQPKAPSSFTIDLDGGKSAKDILPWGTDRTVAKYDLYFDGPGDSDFEVLGHVGSTYTKANAEPGTWLAGIFALNSDGEDVASASLEFTVAAGEDKAVEAVFTDYPMRGVYTLAGSGAAGSADGTGTSASFSAPRGITVDSSGIIYVADTGNNKIRKITQAGVVSTLAGSGAAGSADGTGAAASFDFPVGITTDSSGNVYVSEWGNDAIRRITPAGVVTTFVAGGSIAVLNNPSGLAMDSSGNLYIADTGSSSIKKVTPAGAVSTYAGIPGSPGWFDSADPAEARFDGPQGLAIKSTDGTLYVADTNNHCFRQIAANGTVSTVIGDTSGRQPGFVDGNAVSARMYFPRGIAYGGTIHIADTSNHAIRCYQVFSPTLVTHAGKDPDVPVYNVPESGTANGNYPDARFNSPSGVYIYLDYSFVADTDNNLIRKIVN